MMTVCNEKTLSPVSCEKNILFRHAILLPKIAHPSTSRPSIDHSIPALAPIIDRFHYRRGQQGTSVACWPILKTKENLIETP
jgi:hypothetical protein